MTDAVIVSTARTGLAKSWRGGFNMTHPVTFTAHVLKAAMERAKLDPKEVEDVIVGGTFLEGAAGWNVARQVALRFTAFAGEDCYVLESSEGAEGHLAEDAHGKQRERRCDDAKGVICVEGAMPQI